MKSDKILENFTSKDATRYALQGIYHDPALKFAVATDGHRLFASGPNYQSCLNGKILSKKIGIIEGEFPDYKQVIPASKKKTLVIKFPDWIKRLKKTDVVEAFIGEDLKLEKQNDSDICINLALVADFASEEITIDIQDKHSALVFKPTDSETKECPWFALIMPRRI